MNTRRNALLFLTAGLLLLLLAGGQHAGLTHRRGAENLQIVAPEDTTPLVAITTVAFGAFRGLVADALWVRAAELQENGQYFELVQLATWISHLAPTMPEVWEFQAWNLAYNISVLFSEDEDRWRWVTHGIDLLAADGLRHNPVSPSLHWNLGWLYQHKVGMDFDQSHHHYKAELARKAERVFSRMDWREIVRREFHMRPERISALEASFGPVDWRLPAAHSLYWSDRGLDFSERDVFRARNLQRMRLQSLMDLFRRGDLLVDSDGAPVMGLPRFDLLVPIFHEFDRLLDDGLFVDLVQTNRRNLVAEAVLLFSLYQRISEAQDLYGILAEIDADFQPGTEGFRQFLAANPLDQDPQELSRDKMLARVGALLVLAREADAGDPDRARGLRSVARQAHRRYQSSRMSGEHLERTGLPPFERLEAVIAERLRPGEMF